MTTETSTLPPPVIDYVWNYVSSTVGGQSTLPPIWWLTTVILLSAILYCYRKRPHALAIPKNGLSATVLTVFINHLVNNAVFIVSTYVINYIANYNRPVFDANKWLNTWWSFWVGNYLMAAPCSVFFVTLDRFLALKLSVHYTSTVQRRIGYTAIVFVVALYVFSFANVMIAWPYGNQCITPGTETNPIANRPCLPLLNKIFNYTQQILNVLLSLLNIVIGVIFAVKLRQTKITNIKDGIVRITIVCELIFHAIPAIIQLLFSVAQIMVNLNVYTFFLVSVDTFVCSVLYTKLLFKIFREESGNRPVQISRITVTNQVQTNTNSSVKTQITNN